MKPLIEQQNDFLKRWQSPEIIIDTKLEVKTFTARIIKFINNNISFQLEDLEYVLAVDVRNLDMYYPDAIGNSNIQKVINLLQYENNFVQFLFKLKFLVNEILYFTIEPIHAQYSQKYTSQFFFNYKMIAYFQTCINISKINVMETFTQENEKHKVDFYPKGDEILDSSLVDEVVQNLSGNSKKQYTDALNSYLAGDLENAANSLRKSLESWLKSTLGVDRTLNNIVKNLNNDIITKLNNKIESKLGKGKVATCQTSYIGEFINKTFPHLIELFKKYEIPHDDGGLKHAKPHIVNLLDAELEFMLYQTGAIIRLIDKVLSCEIVE